MTVGQTPREVLQRYANIIEFGPGIYGVCSASWYYYEKAPSQLTKYEMATLVGLMPHPKEYMIYDKDDERVTAETVQFARRVADRRVAQVDALPADKREEVFGVHPDPGANPMVSCSAKPESLRARQEITAPRGFSRFKDDQSFWPRMTRQQSCGDLPPDMEARLNSNRLLTLAKGTAGVCRKTW